jgi:hypothetical protein
LRCLRRRDRRAAWCSTRHEDGQRLSAVRA